MGGITNQVDETRVQGVYAILPGFIRKAANLEIHVIRISGIDRVNSHANREFCAQSLFPSSAIISIPFFLQRARMPPPEKNPQFFTYLKTYNTPKRPLSKPPSLPSYQ